MTGRIVLDVPPATKERIWDHLLSNVEAEQAAFGYAVGRGDNGLHRFELVEWHPVLEEGFETRSAYYMELTDAARAGAIKRAHDIGASLVEFHSHLGPWPAAFSPSDWWGFEEFVPHVWWRLKRRPYLAIVVAESTFDGVVWIAGPEHGQRLDAVRVGGTEIPTTGLSKLTPDYNDD